MRWFTFVVVAIFVNSVATGVDQAQPPTFECRWATSPIEIDGQADEAAWKAAQVIDRFYLPWLKDQARDAKTATKARLLWDREHLYFFADLEDADLFAPLTEHDARLWENDVFELFFKPDEKATGYYEFQVNAAGAVLDMFIAERGKKQFDEMKGDGPFHVKAAVVRRGTLDDRTDRDEGWSVEGRIPWTDLLRTGGRPAENEVWRFALCRYDYDRKWPEPELSTCAPIMSQRSFHHHEEYARLKFLPMAADPARPFGIDKLPPLKTSTVVGSPDPPPPYRPVRAFPNLKLNFPINLDRVPGTDTLLVIIQERSYGTTTIVKLKDTPDASSYENVLDIPQGGVAYGLCFHPRFADNGYLYVGWNGKLEGKPKQTIVTRYTWDHEKQTLDPATALHVIAWESDGHNGGDLEFTQDGMLYVTSGDGTSDSDTNLRGQDLTHLTAKILRIDVDHPENDKAYRVPADNPFVGQPGIVPETWAYGLRNPWRITVDPRTGHVWCAQNGQDLWEQVYFVRKGDNYGWSTYEGSHIFYAERKLGPHPHVLPAAEHHHSEARSLTGGVVYYGSKLPELVGAYIYGDYSTGRIWGVKHDGTKVTWHKLLADTSFAISGFAIDSRGELLVGDHRGDGQGAYYYLEPTPAETAPSKFPRKLSESGLFHSSPHAPREENISRSAMPTIKSHLMAPGVIPYSVNSSLWSDGAHKERFIAIPHKEGADMRIGYARKGGWNFPDETVLVKSFALELTPGDPASRRWIETRLFTRQQGEWAGYSYIWNDEQTDAELVPAEGLDKEYTLQVPRTRDEPEGVRRQTWHYPSRTECMVCHSRAANWVLGLSELQMNKDHDYGGVVDNQLCVLEHLGLLKLSYESDAIGFLKEDLKEQGLADAEIERQVKQLRHKSGQRTAGELSLLAAAPERYAKMPDPYDAREPLESRVRSYLHANCSICHVEAGGGNAQMQLEYSTELSKTGLIDVAPLHHKFGLADPRIVAPGSPERSVLLHRLSHRGPNSGQMPQLSTNLPDAAAVRLFDEWIKSLQP